MEKTLIKFKPFEGFYANNYKISDIIIFDKNDNEYRCDLVKTLGRYNEMSFDFQVNRKRIKKLEKREPFIYNHYLYIPAELVDLKHEGPRENITEYGVIYHFEDYTYEAYVNDKPVRLKFDTLEMSSTDGMKQEQELANELNECIYGQRLTHYEVHNILKKFNITRKEVE